MIEANTTKKYVTLAIVYCWYQNFHPIKTIYMALSVVPVANNVVQILTKEHLKVVKQSSLKNAGQKKEALLSAQFVTGVQ